VRVDHAVEPSSGTVRNVSSTIASMTDWAISGLRPRPGAIVPTASTPPASNFARQRRTVSGVVAHSRAISLFATPSAASNNPDACTTARCGNVVERAMRSNSRRSPRVTFNRTAAIIDMLPPYPPLLFQRRTTREALIWSAPTNCSAISA